MLSLEAWLFVLSWLWAGSYLLQRFLVGKRRCSNHWFVQYGAMAGYYLPAPVAFSAASAVYYSTSDINEPFPLLLGVLTMFIYTILSASYIFGMAPTNMRSYSLRDRPGDRYSFLRWLVLIVVVQWEWARISWLELLGMFICTVLAAFVVLFVKPLEFTLDCETKAVADYMMQRKSSSTSPFFDDGANDSPQLDCCRYPFVQGEDGEWVTVKDLVQRDDLQNEDRDNWLSYSLSLLLARRYYGFHPAEEGDDKVRRFVLANLGRTDEGYKRTFRIVEVQLAFLHDYFFTASLPLTQMGLHYIEHAQRLQLVSACIILSLVTCATDIPGVLDHLVDKIQTIVSGVLLMFMSWCLLFGMPMSLLARNILAFYWDPIHTAFCKFNYCLPIGRPFSVVSLFHASPNPNTLFQTKVGGAYWRNKIGQYSILLDYDRRRSPKKSLVAWFQVIMLSQPSYEFINHLPVEEKEVDIKKLDSMRELVADTLQAIDGPPTKAKDWFWTCKQETHTDTILIWHIATCYCDMTLIDDPLAKRNHEAARALSNYCAYLVAFLPEFLPEHSLTTKRVFQRVLKEAQQELGTKPLKDGPKRTKIRGLQLPPKREQQTTFHKGVELGRQLEKLNYKLQWKVMAKFWAETILYIAPSKNAAAHMEHLAKGGEFITHLWAMLSNAGILKRASTTKKGTTQECPF